MRQEFIRTLTSLAARDPRIVLITGDLGYGVVETFKEAHPNRFFNLGIAEQSMMSVAAGLAKQGLRPFVYSIANFTTFRCLEQIRNDVAFMELPVTIVSVGAGLSYGTAGYSHFLIEDISIMSPLQINIYNPTSSSSLEALLPKMIHSQRPNYVRLSKMQVPDKLQVPDISTYGTSSNQHDVDVIIIFVGELFDRLKIVEEVLGSRGISVLLLKCEDFSQLETALPEVVRSATPIVTVEEHVLRGGFGSIVREFLPNQYQVLHIGIVRVDFKKVASHDELLSFYGLDPLTLGSKILDFLGLGNL